MEWVQTTGRTVDEAVDAALDELGVHAEDVEVEVLEEPKAGFLGRFGGSEARVRVRLKPISLRSPRTADGVGARVEVVGATKVAAGRRVAAALDADRRSRPARPSGTEARRPLRWSTTRFR